VLRAFYNDLRDERFGREFSRGITAVQHQHPARPGTLAPAVRLLGHNGEINTLPGQVSTWAQAPIHLDAALGCRRRPTLSPL